MTREEAIQVLQTALTSPFVYGEYADAIGMAIEALADRPTTDCTKFMEWLKAEVLDEENWELNAVANGEIICRKLKKLGWLDVEDGYYVDTRPTGEWIKTEHCLNDTGYRRWIEIECSFCGERPTYEFLENMKYCPHCGAYMNETRAYG